MFLSIISETNLSTQKKKTKPAHITGLEANAACHMFPVCLNDENDSVVLLLV